MRDRELFRRILGLEEPWRVEDLELDTEKERVIVHVDHRPGPRFPCPECQRQVPGYDSLERSWRHLDTCQYVTILKCRVPRVNCPEHGVHQIEVPWAERGSRWTVLFERLAIDWIEEAGRSGIARMLGLTWNEADTIMKRAVRRGLARQQPQGVPRLGVDEKSSRKGHRYVTVVCDLDLGRVLHVSKGRSQTSLAEYYQTLSAEQLRGIKAVAMDMHDPYVSATRQFVPDAAAKIVYDKFHISKHLNEAVDTVRKEEHRRLKAQGDDSLTGTKYDWLRNPEKFDRERWIEFDPLRKSKLKTARAWAIKDLFGDFWEYTYQKSARWFFDSWYQWAIRSRLEPIKQKARMLKRRLLKF